MRRSSPPFAFAYVLPVGFLLAYARPARAQPWFDASEARLEDRFADGDVDVEDLARLPAFGRRVSAGGGLMAQSWVSLVGYTRQYSSGPADVGAGVVVGLALDKIAEGRRLRVRPVLSDGPAPAEAPQPPPGRPANEAARARPPSPSPPSPRPALDAALARGSVRAAWRASGIEVSDARIDAMISRSRVSAVLPETRLRVMQVFQDGEHASSYVDEAGTVVNTSGTTTTIEARLTWRLDRLIFADDEPALERLRLEREEARGRIGARVLELLFQWQRAILDAAASDADSRAEVEADLHRLQAEVALDVLTAGWFGAQPAVRPGTRARGR